MATKARQQYFADEVSLSKEKREFSIADEIQQKIDSIEPGAQVNKIETVKVNGTALVPDANKAVNIDVPEVIDNLYTVDSDNALSAKQGKLLYDYIQNIASRGRFLSNWNSTTGLPMTNPSESPYPYKSGDYFVVSNVAGLGGTNYRPDGSSYTIGQASTVVETEDVSVSDFYFYDGTNWLLLSNSGRQVAVDTSLSTTSTNPVENRVITNALNNKQNILTAGNHIDITNNVISAEGFQEELTAGDNITIQDICTTESDMRGPCPSGWHIGTQAEYVNICNIGSNIGAWIYKTSGTDVNLPTYLKRPASGIRGTNGNISSQGSWYYWTSENFNVTYAFEGGPQNTKTWSRGMIGCGNGCPIRPLRNVGLAPDSSWVTIYDGSSTASGAGIFWSTAEGAISISADGTTWYTMADKNLGATTVYNYGDTRTEANCGGYFQWGNNHMFPGIGNSETITTSSNKVDVTGYGPGNYYDSSTFITGNDGWIISNNSNLRGGVTKGTFQDCNLTISATNTTYTAGTNVQISNQNVISATDTKYTAGTGISIDANNVISNTQTSAQWGNITGTLSNQTDLQNALDDKQDELTAGEGISIDANNEISNTLPGAIISATAPSNPTEGMVWYDTANDSLKAYNGTSWETEGTEMVVLSYGHSTWQEFIDAYNKNAIVYCKASSNSNPGSGVQGRMAFMAFVSINSTTLLPTEVEFQYYRSRSDHNTAANQLDQVFVYKLTSASGGTWTVTERNTGAKAVAGTGISLGRGSGNMTISADTSVLATKTDLNSKQDTLVSGTNIKTINSNSLLGSGDIALNDVKVSATAPSSPTEGMTWYDTTNHILKVYDGTNWVEPGDNNVKVFTTTNSVVIDGGDFKNDTTLVNTILDINNWMTSSPSHIAYLYYVDGNHMYYKCPVIWCKSSSATKHIAYLLSTGTSPKFDHFHRAYVNLFMSGGTATVGEIILSEAPTYTAGENITIDQNNEISATDTTYTAGEGIAIGAVRPDNQGPCEDGFHIPLHSELQTLFSARTSLGFTDTQSQQFLTYLHIPVGRRDFTGVSEPGDQACLWGADGIEANGEYWVMSIFDSTEHPEDNYIEVTTIWGVSQCFGYPIRAFKDTPIVPDNSWTTEYQGTGNAGIFHNSTLGLISVSSDGTNWITFKDKNLGATTVYNYGDTITDTNLGNVYQRGNNYGFPFTGNITTSSGTVDASNYGPGNYYSSSTFITRTYQTYNQPRDNSGNRNLWGGVSQGTWIGGDGNTIVNTGVLSVNGSTGVVTLNDVKVSSTAPSSPTEGMTWYDTTNDQLKVYDGTNWNVTGKEYNAGEGIEIGTIQDYSAMQGPAPDGFHVPRNTERQAVKTVWTALGGGSSDGTNFGIALKLPFAGYRFCSSAGIGSQGSYGFYWSSSRNNTNNAYLLNFNSSDVLPQNANYRAFGYSVRCFKNSPTVPTSSWTKLYGTSIEAGGIFWSSTEGLISMSSDGQTWITIQDKNLGATTVWNSGDTLSEANCGKYYQRGNNYGFPRTGSVTTSSTQVDASTYGPGNYYSSSTFITRNSSPYRWDTTDNGNLRGGVTGVVTYDNAITNTGVLSVNGQTGNITIETFQLAPNSPLTPKYRRYGTQAQYEALTQYYTDEAGDTVYFTI